MFVVDICGVTGTGKSTVVNAMRGIGGFVLANNTVQYNTEFARKLNKNEDLQPFLRMLDTMFATAKGDKVGIRKRHMYRSLTELITYQSSELEGIAVIDGGLCQRGISVDLLKSDITSKQYYDLMPLPDTIVYCQVDQDTVIQRNQQRGGKHDRSKDIRRQFKVCDNLLDSLIERRFQVDGLYTDNPAEVAAQVLIHRIKSAYDAYINKL